MMDTRKRGNAILQWALQQSSIKTISRRLSFSDEVNKENVNNNSSNNEAGNKSLQSTDDDHITQEYPVEFPVFTELQPIIFDSPTPDSMDRTIVSAYIEDPTPSANLNNSTTQFLEAQIVTLDKEIPDEPAGQSRSVLAESIISLQSDQQCTSSSTGQRKRKAKEQKQYLDYLSDDETNLFSECDDDSDVWEGTSGSETDNEDENMSNIKKRNKRKILQELGNGTKEECIVGESGIMQKRKNKRQERKKLKQAGKEYTNSTGNLVAVKKVQPNPCNGKKCGNDCGSIPEEKRKCIFDHFWKLPTERRKDWLVPMSQKMAIKRKRSSESQKRNVTYKYFINEGEGKRPVCLQFLALTLDVSHKLIYYTLSNAQFGSAKEDLRGKCEPPNKTKETTKAMVMKFIKSLPAIPSHYCRKDSSRIYLPQDFKNLSNLYHIYKNEYIEKGIDVVSERVFRTIFTEHFNIGFYVPKKDKCLKCLKFERLGDDNSSTVKEKEEHQIEKTESFTRFKSHQNIHKSDSSTLCVSFDLQKVLNTPHGNSMLLYYSRKLAVYNLCFYESATRNVYCFYWDEVNGKRGANEIATILNRYIGIVDERGTVKNLLLYCDCCPGQNRNRVILAMIHSTLQTCKNIDTIQINYLLSGHTYMPVDSVHAVIEKNVKNCIIYAPSQWYTVFTTARQDPKPYNVELMAYRDFQKWDVVSEKYFKGNLTGKISKVRVVTIKKKDDAKISVKYSMKQSAESFLVEVQSKAKVAPAACYKSLLPISQAKYSDLQKVCKDKVIPAAFQHEYVNIPTASNIKDMLPETDIEDGDSE